VSLAPGDAIALELPGNPAAGYQWTLESPEGDTVSVAPSGFQPAGAGVGSGGVEGWTITARAGGTASLSFKNWRPWAGESSVVDRFAMTIAVASPQR